MTPESELATITKVAKLSRSQVAIQYLGLDDRLYDARVDARDWPEGYYPPAVGDVIETRPTIALKLRPR